MDAAAGRPGENHAVQIVGVVRDLREWLESGRPTRSDWLIASLLAGSAFVLIAISTAAWWEQPFLAVQALLVCGSLVFRRRYPNGVLWFQYVVSFGLHNVATAAAIVVGGYSAGAHGRRLALSAGSVVAAALCMVAVVPVQPPGPTFGALVAAAWLVGATIRAYRDRALSRRREGEARREVAAAEERSRIARELHDIVAHSVSVMVVQAEAARTQVHRDPDAALQALESISATGREAMAELRHILGVLHERDGEAQADPQPELAQVDSLVQRVREAGLPVELRVEGAPRVLPPGLGVTAYRIVQEALTNAVKHTGNARTVVVIRWGEQDLTLEIADEGGQARADAADGSGRGLVGMRQRVVAYGGELEVGPRPGRGYTVRARLPLAS